MAIVYKVVKEFIVSDFETKLNYLADLGYEPVGSMTVNTNRDTDVMSILMRLEETTME